MLTMSDSIYTFLTISWEAGKERKRNLFYPTFLNSHDYRSWIYLYSLVSYIEAITFSHSKQPHEQKANVLSFLALSLTLLNFQQLVSQSPQYLTSNMLFISFFWIEKSSLSTVRLSFFLRNMSPWMITEK